MYEPIAVVVFALVVALFIMHQRNLCRAAEPQLSEALSAGFALTDAINASAQSEAATRQAAQTALALCRDGVGDLPTDLASMRGRLETAAATADSAAEQATALACRIRLHHAEFMHAAESSPLKLKLLRLAGSEAMEYRLYAEDTASSLDEVADQAHRAAAEARARGRALPRR